MNTNEITYVLDAIKNGSFNPTDMNSHLYQFGRSLGEGNVEIDRISALRDFSENNPIRSNKDFEILAQGYLLGLFLLFNECAEMHETTINDLLAVLKDE